jgi:hypothetical protein
MNTQLSSMLWRVAMGVITLLLLLVCVWYYVAPRVSPATSQAKYADLQSRAADGSSATLGMTRKNRESGEPRSADASTMDISAQGVQITIGGATSDKGTKKSPSSLSNKADSAIPLLHDNGKNMAAGSNKVGKSVAAGDIALLMARAVEAEIVENDEGVSTDPMEAAVLAAQNNGPAENEETRDLAVLNLLAEALVGKFNAEEKADILALASDASERTGISVSSLVTYALSPGQPLTLQRQALYLATKCNIELVSTIAKQSNHPLQQDAQSFLLENELSHGRRPATTDDDTAGEKPPQLPPSQK